MKTSRKLGAQMRWERRYRRTVACPRTTTPKLGRIVASTRRILWQMLVGVAITLVVIGIALWDASIRNFLIALAMIAPGVGLAFGGYPQVGVLLIVVAVSVSSWFLYSWCREEMLETTYPVSWSVEEASVQQIREPI